MTVGRRDQSCQSKSLSPHSWCQTAGASVKQGVRTGVSLGLKDLAILSKVTIVRMLLLPMTRTLFLL